MLEPIAPVRPKKSSSPISVDAWPELPLAAWEPTYATLHRWAQILGKVQLALTPRLNHWWNVAQRVTSRGLTTGMLCGEENLGMTLDFVDHRLVAETPGAIEAFELEPMTVATFYEKTLAMLARLGVEPHLWGRPVEVADTTPFREDTHHAAYDRLYVERFHHVLLSVNRVFEIHRARFLGKSSPSHFFWGAFDLAVTRFSGRRNPTPPSDPVMGPAYSHEVISHGFWPGGDFLGRGRIDHPIFYAYAVPEPEGFRTARVEPKDAAYDPAFGEFLLPYDAVRTAKDPAATLLAFMESTYVAGARSAGWDVEDLAAVPTDE